MIRWALALLVLSTPAAAQWACQLENPACTTGCTTLTVQFAVDPNQFVAAQSPDDPPRRQVTTVTMDDATFVAEAILMDGGVEGFHEDAGELGSRLMVVQPDGQARLHLRPANQTFVGTCTR